MAQIIILHGASSSGKSTLARALQARVDQPFWHISIDHLRDGGVLPMERFNSGEFDWARARGPFFNGFHASLGAYADAGNNLIVETILDTAGWLDDLKHQFRNHDVLFVAVHCPLPLLIEREKTRGDRKVGSAEQDFRTIHRDRIYDLDLHSEDGTDLNVDLILQTLVGGIRRSEFSSSKG